MQQGRGGTGNRARQTALAFTAAALLVSGFYGGVASAAEPTVSNPTAFAVTGTTATLRGTVNPGGVAETKWRFLWGTADCTVNSCKPTGKGTLPIGTSPVAVEKALTGLLPSTVYHFVLEAENTDGTVTSEDSILFTPGAPSEGLPDNRAYEQATPTEKNGEDADGQFALIKAPVAGNGITFFATFGIPGGKGAQALPSYLALREGDGAEAASWASQGLLPPPDLGERAQVQGWLPDFSKTYANATKLGNPRTKALIEQSTDGTTPPQIISPYTAKAEYSYVGASADASVVLFESEAQLRTKTGGSLIAAAIPGAPNVYAWDRATGEVSLAGVLNSGDAPSRGTIAGPYAWSRGIETNTLVVGGAKLGYYLQGTHALSDSGDVYFTEAGTGQLYLRLNPTQPQSDMAGEVCTEADKACTIHVSASKRTTPVPGPDPAGPQPAAFQAASADGSVAYFTSAEKLTDESNTGPEQPEAAIGTGDTSGTLADPSLLSAHAIGVATAGTHLYWADPTEGTIGRSGLDGANPEQGFIAIPPGECEVETAPGTVETLEVPSTPRYVAVDAAEKYVYWTNSGLLDEQKGTPIDGGGTIGRAELDGSGNPVPDSVDPDFICGETESRDEAVSNPQGIAVNATHIYWTNAATEDFFNRSLARAQIDGGGVEPELFSPSSPDGFFPDRIPQGLALDASHVYFGLDVPAGSGTSYIERVTLAGTEPLAPSGFHVGSAGIRGLALDGTNVYWANQGEEAIWRVPLADLKPASCGSSCVKLFEPEGDLNGLALAGSDLYWSVNGEAPSNPGTDLYRFEAGSGGGGTLEDLTYLPAGNGAEAQGVLGASDDGSQVYFAANGDLDEGGAATQGDCETSRPHGSIAFTKGSCNVYLWSEGETSFVGRVRGADAIDWTGTPREVFSGFAPKSAFVTEDGQTLLFRSGEKLSAFENEGTPQLYRFRVGEPGLDCVSCPASGEAGKGPSLGSIRFPGTISPALANMGMLEGRNLSGDGNRVFFETGDALVGADTNGQGGCPGVGPLSTPACQDVYEWEAPDAAGGSCTTTAPAYSPINDGCLYLLSSGKSPSPSYFADASRSGADVFFFTRQSLVVQDRDELQDVYDARIGGGIAAQNALPAIPCETTESCHAPYNPAPAETTPATPGFFGPADAKQKHKKAAKAKKHKHKKHNKKQKHKQKKHKRAGAERGARR